MSDATDAISHCHRRGIYHRDIKLENFVLRGQGLESGLLLIDFGLARYSDDACQELIYDEVGTKAYHAPEIGTSAGHYLDRADVWALGVRCSAVRPGSRSHAHEHEDRLQVQT